MNKKLQRIVTILLVLIMLLSLLPLAVSAEGDTRFDGKDWDTVLSDFFAAHHTDTEHVAVGFKNLVSGEEHFFNGDKYMTAGSMYKIPLNMIFLDKITNGELQWDTLVGGLQYQKALEFTIVNSDNDTARSMWTFLGGYPTYKRALCEYIGLDPDSEEGVKFCDPGQNNNDFTAEQIIYCLNYLYQNESRFPRLIDTLKQAEPHNYFKLHEQKFDIAHKYGYLIDGTHFYLNDCAICYTDEPTAIVLFTDNVSEPYQLLTDFCTLMCDWAQYRTAQRRAEEQAEAEAAAIAALNAPPAESEAPVVETSPAPAESGSETVSMTPAPTPAPSEKKGSGLVLPLVLAALVLVLAVLSFSAARKKASRGKLALLPAVLAVVITAGALLFCLFDPLSAQLRSASAPSKLSSTNNNEAAALEAQKSVNGFFSALVSGHYDEAYAYLDGVSSLGLESLPESESAQKLYAALQQSYSYKLYGDCTASGRSAVQQVVLVRLDMNALRDDLQTATDAAAERLRGELGRKEIYDEDGAYLASFTDRAYGEAVDAVLVHAESYYETVALNVNLTYRGGQWLIEPDNALYSALLGGAV